MERQRTSSSTGGAVVAGWAVLNAGLAAGLLAFPGPFEAWRVALYASSALVLLLGSLVVFARPRRAGPPKSSGAPALAFAAACLAGALAWVFGVFLAYFALPPLAFCVARWRSERRASR